MVSLKQILESRDGTIKLIIDFGSGHLAETVLIPKADRTTVCLSSEIGCNMGCRFCLTAKLPLRRRLESTEIVDQFKLAYEVARHKLSRTVDHIVFMGMGEPLDNSVAVRQAILALRQTYHQLQNPESVTISTVGLAERIVETADWEIQLAVSLNATTDEIRSRLMPITKRHSIERLLLACQEYQLRTNQVILLEYVILKGLNHSREDARRLMILTWNLKSKINLIPFNAYSNAEFQSPSDTDVETFAADCLRYGLVVSRRETRGPDILAACGQLYPSGMRPN